MKIKLLLLGLGLSVSTSVLAQTPKTSIVQQSQVAVDPTQKEEAFLVDEDALQNALFKLALQLRQKKAAAPKTSHKMQLLRYQMLLNMLNNRVDKRVAQQKIYEAQAKANACHHIEVVAPELGNSAVMQRLERLEMMLNALVDNRIAGKKKMAIKPVVIDTTAVDTTKKVPEVDPQALAQNAKLDSLQARLNLLMKANDRIMEELEKPEVTISEEALVDNDALIDSVMVDTVYQTREIVNTEIVKIPADFSRIVYFKVGSTELTDQSIQLLDEVVDFYNRFPNAPLMLSGFASEEGGKDFNMNLAEKRTQVVADYLITHGCQGLINGGATIEKNEIAKELARKVVISLFLEKEN